MEKIAAGGILIDEFKRILLIKRKYTKKFGANYWSTPAGGQENNETLEETAIREVKEEVGLDFIPEKMFVKDIFQDKSNLTVYRFLGKYSGKIIIQESECDGYGWYSFEETKNLLVNEKLKEMFEKLHEEDLI